MKYENLFKIHIPEPCHEDWDKMSPNEQGSFCNVCAKTVVDFSGKTNDDIQRYLLENIDKKVCGRFKVTQLLNNDDEAEVPKLRVELDVPRFKFPGFLLPVMTPFRAYAMAVMLFASAALSAGCGNSGGRSGGDDEMLGGQVMVIDSTESYNLNDHIQGGLKYTPPVKDSVCTIPEDDKMIVGKIRPVEKIDTLKADTSEVMIKGDIQRIEKEEPKKEEQPVRKMGIVIKKETKKD